MSNRHNDQPPEITVRSFCPPENLARQFRLELNDRTRGGTCLGCPHCFQGFSSGARAVPVTQRAMRRAIERAKKAGKDILIVEACEPFLDASLTQRLGDVGPENRREFVLNLITRLPQNVHQIVAQHREVYEGWKELVLQVSTTDATSFEPCQLSPEDKIDWIARLREQGTFDTIVLRFQPFVPGLSSLRRVEEILSRAKQAGLERFIFGVLRIGGPDVLRYQAILPTLQEYIEEGDLLGQMRLYPADKERAIVTTVRAIADELGLRMGLCMSPHGDLASGPCD